VDRLVQLSGAGRLHDQDAILNPKVGSLDELVTLPEFIREPMPQEIRRPISSGDVHSGEQGVSISKHKKSRSRSISAPQWLRPATELGRRLSKSRPGSSHGPTQPAAEHQQQQGQQGKYWWILLAKSNHPTALQEGVRSIFLISRNIMRH